MGSAGEKQLAEKGAGVTVNYIIRFRVGTKKKSYKLIMGNVLKNGWWLFGKNFLKCHCQFQEEAGAVGEQPASNKIDANKARRSKLTAYSFFLAV